MIKKQFLKRITLILILVFLGICLFQMPIYAAEETLTDIINQTVSGVFYFGRIVCMVFLFIVAICCFAYTFILRTPDAIALFRRTVLYIVVGIIAIAFLALIVNALLVFNEVLINWCMDIGGRLSGLGRGIGEDAYGEASLYDAAITKAYEIKASSGFLGMIMYIILIFFSVRFFFVYLRRYINVMILIIVSPWVIVRHVMRRTFKGTKGKLGLWTKEMIFNIYIQPMHAFLYAVCMGLTVSASTTALNYVGMILTLVVFAFMSSIEGIIRRIFNFVGGSSSVRTVVNTKKVKETVKKAGKSLEKGADKLAGKVGGMSDSLSSGATNIKDKASETMNKLKDTAKDLPNKVKEKVQNLPDELSKSKDKLAGAVSKTVDKTKEKIHELPQDIRKGAEVVKNKAVEKVKEMPAKIKRTARRIRRKIKNYSYKELRKIKRKLDKRLSNNINYQTAKSLGKLYKMHSNRQQILNRVSNGTASPEEIEAASQFDDMPNINDDSNNMQMELTESRNMAVSLYMAKGPSPFIMSSKYGGSPELGMMMMQSSMDISRSLSVNKSEEKRTLNLSSVNSLHLKDEVGLEEDEDETEDETVHKKHKNKNRSRKEEKRYTFSRFSSSSVATITDQLMLETALSDKNVYALIKVRAKMNETEVVAVGNLNNEINTNQQTVTSSQTIHTSVSYSSKTTKNDLIELQFKRDASLQKLKERQNDNNWANYVSSNNSTMEFIGSEVASQSIVEQRRQEQIQYNNVYSGVVVYTAMQHSVALENVDIRKDEILQKEMIDNLSTFNICQEEETMTSMQREQAIENLESKIYSLTTDDKTTYYNMVVEFDKMAKEEGIDVTQNEGQYTQRQTEKVTQEVAQNVTFSERTVNTNGNTENATQSEVYQESSRTTTTTNEVVENTQFSNNNTENVAQNEGKQSQTEAETVRSSGSNTQESTRNANENANQTQSTHRSYSETESATHTNTANETEGATPFSSENTSNSNNTGEETASTSNSGKISFKNRMVNFVENVSGLNLTNENGNLKSMKEMFETGVDNYFDPDGYANVVIKAAVEAEADLVKTSVKDKVNEFGTDMKEAVTETVDEVLGKTPGKNGTKKETVAERAIDAVIDPFDLGKKGGSNNDKDNDAKKDEFVVFVYGEVNRPGKVVLNSLKKGQYYIIEDALVAAGWVTDDADLSKLNLSAKLERGMIIRVPKRDNSASERELEEIVNEAIRTYIESENIKDYSILRNSVNQKGIKKLIYEELEDRNLTAEEHQIDEFIEKRIKELEKANEKVFNLTTEEQKQQAKAYRDAQKQKAINDRIAERQREEEEQARYEESEKLSREAVADALEELSKKKEVIVNSNNKDERVREARKLYMDNDVLTHA